MKFHAEDCRPLVPQPTTAGEVEWLRRLSRSIDAGDLVIPMSNERDDDEPIIYCDRDGTWLAGRYVGSISFEGHTLTIDPRFGLPTLQNWLSYVKSVVLTESPGELTRNESFIPRLLAAVWAHAFVTAARHGLPRLNRQVASQHSTIRGRLDVSASLRLIALGRPEVVSIRAERSIEHAASDAIVAAYNVLRRWLAIPDHKWLPGRAQELIPHFLMVTGPRPRVPTKAELDRIRYTPITSGFGPLAELSRQIAKHQGMFSNVNSDGKARGVLLDVAELWEMYVLSILRQAATPLTVTHGTRDTSRSKHLLRSEVTGKSFGTLLPDAILHSGPDIFGIVDAKYKSIYPTAHAPHGPQREDLYQMAAYLAKYTNQKKGHAWGLFAYPNEPMDQSISPAEKGSPWSIDEGKKVVFASLPHDPPSAIAKLRLLIGPFALTPPR